MVSFGLSETPRILKSLPLRAPLKIRLTRASKVALAVGGRLFIFLLEIQMPGKWSLVFKSDHARGFH